MGEKREYRLCLFDRISRASKVMEIEWDGTEHEFLEYCREGNLGCDCNRSLRLYGHDSEYVLPCNRRDNVIAVLWLQSPWDELIYFEMP